MAKKRSPVMDYLVYLAVRLLVCVIQMLDWTSARKAAELLAWIGYHVDKRHRKVALDNLRRAFPGRYTEAEMDRMVRAVYRHFATLVTEIILIPRKLHVKNHKYHVFLVDQEKVLGRMFTERPTLIVTGHFGNWELAGYYMGLCGCKTYAVARTLDNPYLDAFLRRFRENTGQKILAKKGDFDQMLDVLSSNGIMATLGDQDAGSRGLFVDFFGRPASTHKAIALLALEHNVPIVVSVAYKIGEPMKYRIVTGDVILPEEYRDRPDAVRAITERFTADLERLIRLAPEQYLWLHNRWKHQPAAKKGKKAA
jgi:KDO2-lipid IV(A) lauroyltransferase